MPEKKEEAKKTLGTEEWEDERIKLTEDLAKAKQALWDHSHPVIESESEKIQTEYRKSLAAESKKTTKKADQDEATTRSQ